jgi:transcriptional regulator with XRE-family HTH domain
VRRTTAKSYGATGHVRDVFGARPTDRVTAVKAKRRRGPPPNKERHRLAARLRADGLSLEQVGERLGITKQAVASLFKTAGIKAGPRRRVTLCCRCNQLVGPSTPRSGFYGHDKNIACLTCVRRDHTATFGQYLRALRLNAGLSQMELADLVGVRPVRIGHWEASHTYPPREYVERIAAALGVDFQELAQRLAAMPKRGRWKDHPKWT